MAQVRCWIVASSVVLAASFALAQDKNKFDGTWAAALAVNGQRCTINLVMGPGQRYSEIVQCGALMTRQTGTYVLGQNGMLVRNVVNWEPKQRYVVDGNFGGHYEPNAKPPGGSYQVTFISPTKMVWKDVNFGGVVTFQRSH